MSHTDNKIAELPEGYEHVEARLASTTDRLQAMDEQIKNTPNDRGPALTLEPPGAGFMRSRQPGSRDQVIAFIEQQKNKLKADTLTKTEQDTREGDAKAGRVVRDQVREALFPNPYRNMGKAEMAEEKTAMRDMEQAADYMDAKLVQAAVNRTVDPQPDPAAPEKKEATAMSMSARFSQSLGYTKATEKTNKTLTLQADASRDIDRD